MTFTQFSIQYEPNERLLTSLFNLLQNNVNIDNSDADYCIEYTIDMVNELEYRASLI